MVWVEGDANGWACSNCQWKFPVPTLLSETEAMSAYDRLAALKFREHRCEDNSSEANQVAKQQVDSAFSQRARELIKHGYKPKVAVDLVLHEIEIEHSNNPRFMEKARTDAENFLLNIRRGLI